MAKSDRLENTSHLLNVLGSIAFKGFIINFISILSLSNALKCKIGYYGIKIHFNRPFLHGGHLESPENKKLCFCAASLALNSRLAEACLAKTKLFIPPRLKMAAK